MFRDRLSNGDRRLWRARRSDARYASISVPRPVRRRPVGLREAFPCARGARPRLRLHLGIPSARDAGRLPEIWESSLARPPGGRGRGRWEPGRRRFHLRPGAKRRPPGTFDRTATTALIGTWPLGPQVATTCSVRVRPAGGVMTVAVRRQPGPCLGASAVLGNRFLRCRAGNQRPVPAALAPGRATIHGDHTEPLPIPAPARGRDRGRTVHTGDVGGRWLLSRRTRSRRDPAVRAAATPACSRSGRQGAPLLARGARSRARGRILRGRGGDRAL